MLLSAFQMCLSYIVYHSILLVRLFFSQNGVKKPKCTKYLHAVLLQEGGSTVTRRVQLTIKQSAGSNARATNRLETIHSESPTPPGTPVAKVINMSWTIEVILVARAAILLVSATDRDSWCWPKGARPLGTRMDRSLIATVARSLRNDDSENVTPKCKFLIFGKETNFFLLSRCYYKMNLHSLTTKLERFRKRERTVKIKLYFLSGPPQDVTWPNLKMSFFFSCVFCCCCLLHI